MCTIYTLTYDPECSAAATLDANDKQSDMVDLPVGDYTIEVNYLDGNNSPGESRSGPFVESDLVGNTVTTPEPREPGVLIAMIGVMFLAKACWPGCFKSIRFGVPLPSPAQCKAKAKPEKWLRAFISSMR